MFNIKKHNSSYKYIFQNSIAGSLKIIISITVTLSVLPFLVSKIGLYNYGILALTNTFTGLTGLFDLGLSKSLVYLVNKKAKDQMLINYYISTGFIINISIALFLIILSIIVILLNINIFGNILTPSTSHIKIIAFISILILALNVYNTFQASILESFLLLHYVNIGYIINIISINSLYLINIFSINNFALLLFTPVVSYLITSLYYYLIIKKKIKYILVKPPKQFFNEMIKTTGSFFKIGLFTSIHLPMNRLLLTYNTLSLHNIAILDISLKITLFLNNILSNLSNPLFGIISKNKNEGKKTISNIMIISAILVGLFYLLYTFFHTYIINFFFKNEVQFVSQIHTVLHFLILGLGIFAVVEPINKYMMGIGEFNKLFKVRLLIVLVNVILFYSISLFQNAINSVVYSYVISLTIFSSYLISFYYTQIIIRKFNKC